MKPKPYALKPWWPRSVQDAALSIGPLAMFRRQVALAARRRGLSVAVQDFAVAAVAGLDVNSLRPDVGRQVNEWVAQHQQLPRALQPKRPRKLPNPLPPPVQKPRHQPQLRTLAREAFVTRLIEVEHQPLKQVATQLGVTREIVRQIHARARRRIRKWGKPHYAIRLGRILNSNCGRMSRSIDNITPCAPPPPLLDTAHQIVSALIPKKLLTRTSDD